jgi:hypothetical protein
MKWSEFLNIVSDQSAFTSALLMAGRVCVHDLRRQLSRWVGAGRIIQLRRGVYTLAPPYRKLDPHPFLLANTIGRASYVSLQSALAHYGMIPEHVPIVTSVTTGRPEIVKNELGIFVYRHVKPAFFTGFRQVEVAANQSAFLATPEKSLLDLVYLTPGADSIEYLRELRLQHLELMDKDLIMGMAEKMGRPKLVRAVKRLQKLSVEENYEEL